MFPLLHLAIPMLFFELPQIKETYKVNRYALLIGALFPDIIDKPLQLLNIGGGRAFGHTLLFLIIAFVSLHLLSKGNKSVSIPFLFGMIFHLILDIPYVPLFYPFISYEFPTSDLPAQELWIEKILSDPYVYITEFVGLFILIYILISNELYGLNDIFNYLKTNPEELKENTNKPKKNIN